MAYWKRRRSMNLSPTQIIAIAFATIILLGALLLTLPVASRNGQSCGFLTALFTSTSSTCVTGLVLNDTWTQWSGFGQAVIISLIEVGGLGVMSAASLAVFILRRKVGLKQRMLMAQALSVEDLESVIRLQKWAIFGSLFIQLIGALVLTVRFLPDYGFGQAVIWGIFHAVSAFCNAGFDIFGSIEPGAGAMIFQSDPVVLITLMALIIIGGLGFLVWDEVVRLHSFRKFSVYTKLVLLTTLVLLVGGAGLFMLLEWNNPGTLGAMDTGDKILNACFQSTTLRTAGFASVDQSALTDPSKSISMLMMLVGGSSGSTAGGLKTVTFVVLLLFAWNRARGKQSVNVFRKRIPNEKLMDAMTIALIVVLLAFTGATIVSATSNIPFMDSLFETVSALGTVGLSTGVTSALSVPAQLVIILFMYFGRVGILTISLGFLMGDRVTERFQYAHTNLLIG